jgi:protein-S-isoprenylcysteine O-methyltransferase Ste14
LFGPRSPQGLCRRRGQAFLCHNHDQWSKIPPEGSALDRQKLQRQMYELHDASTAERLTLAAIGALWLLVAWWLLLGGGLETAGGWFGRVWTPGNIQRSASLAGGITVYYIRILFTEFVFLKRGVSWREVLTIASWLLGIYLLLGIAGGRNAEAFGALGAIGVAIFLVGSWMNTSAEYNRHAWKQRPENHGHLYTQGLFRYTRHPNYLGDLVLFSGLCLISGALVTAVIPLLMLAGFVFVNIPVLDSHLRQKYGEEFEAYARRTKKLIPFLY